MSEKSVTIETEETAEAKAAAEKEALRRKSYPAGWSAEQLDHLDPEFASRVEAVIAAIERPTCRVRPSRHTAAPGATSVTVVLIGVDGEKIAHGDDLTSSRAVRAVESAARAVGLSATATGSYGVLLSAAPIDEPAAIGAPPAPAGEAPADESTPARRGRRA